MKAREFWAWVQENHAEDAHLVIGEYHGSCDREFFVTVKPRDLKIKPIEHGDTFDIPEPFWGIMLGG